ncbi:hypothetical protein E1286_01215 [Nonomuraea terrae]|uniref:Dipeptidyl aminopeptidase n=1 Tax=Nonomuraea terrae TaxID=2530383 RepID=A0A4R4ZH02_9ACTN|nr:hypothetical protein [Nonomuraea terrae]TDD56954.1 hypothetical protein E1286_01215 [Nonomuraea terrae]
MRSVTYDSWRRERNRRQRVELEDFLRRTLVDGYATRREDAWRRDHTDEDAYAASVEPNRLRWARLLGVPELKPAGPVEVEDHPLRDDVTTKWVRLPLDNGLSAEAVLATPRGDHDGRLVVFQHGLDSVPEIAFEVCDGSGAYHEAGVELVRRGFTVLAPFNVAGYEERNRLQRLAWIGGGLVEGIEFARARCLLDVVADLAPVDPGRIGMWGRSWGGLATQYWMPLEPRLRAGVISSYFNERLGKLAVPDPRYTCFLDTPAFHAHHPGLLREFADADLLSLICPRPVMVQHGWADDIGWPAEVAAEFERAREHWARLGHADRVRLELHGGGHEAEPDSAITWLERWL